MLILSNFTKRTVRANHSGSTHIGFLPLGLSAALLLCAISPTYASGQNATLQSARFYPNTGFSVGSAFLEFFDAHGGVRMFGYPLSGEMAENGRTVQYFERQRFEYHKEAIGSDYQVQLGALGVAAAQGKISLLPITASRTISDHLYFSETRHTISGTFLAFWRANGSIRIFGYPISEPAIVNGYLTQYFERARLEYHPEAAATGYAVQLGQLGKEYLALHPGLVTSTGANTTVAGITGASTPLLAGTMLSPGSQQLLDLINGARQRIGAKSVVLSSQVSSIAQQRSNDMAARFYFSHVTPEGKSYGDFLKASGVHYKFSGEILAENNFPESQAAAKSYEGFMASPDHHDILLDPRYNFVGVGEARDSRGYYIFTVIFIQQ